MGRHTLRSLVRGGLSRLAGSENGLAHTAVQLAVRPGVVVRDYLSGRTTPYTHPAGYLLVATAVLALILGRLNGATGAGETDKFWILLVVPFVAGASRIVFWRARLNYAEHLILILYLAGEVLVLMALLSPGTLFFDGEAVRTYAAVGVGACGCWFAWAYSRMFVQRPITAALGGILALAAGIAAWLIVTVALLGVLRK